MNLKQHLVADWHWVLNHSWSVRLIMLAFVLSGAEVVLPLFSDNTHPFAYALATAGITGGAFVARLMAQKKVIGAMLE
jgi:hypothetical protein